jgi:hypothetical protein
MINPDGVQGDMATAVGLMRNRGATCISLGLHGWLWLVCGFTGSILGTYVRKWLGDGPYRRQ